MKTKNQMKSLIAAFILLPCVATLSSCDKKGTENTLPAPVVDFTYVLSNSQAPATVTFTNKTTNGKTFSWDFADNTSSTQTNPVHTFTVGGDYAVKLNSTGDGGSATVTKIVKVLPKPTKVTISKIVVTAMPFKDSTNTDWDSGDGPDVFFKINNAAGTLLFENSGTRSVDVSSTALPLTLGYTPAYDFTSITAGFTIELWDYDTAPDASDRIGAVDFLMSDYSVGSGSLYPTTFTKTKGGITMTLTVTWQ